MLDSYKHNFSYNSETGIVTWKQGRFRNQVAGTWLGNGYLGTHLRNEILKAMAGVE